MPSSPVCAALGLIALGLAGGAAAAPISGAQDGWAAITACARTPDDEARRDCMDGVLRRAGMLSSGLPRTVVVPPPVEERRRLLGVPLPTAGTGEARDVTLGRTRIDGEGRLELVTTEGETWRSRDPGLELPRTGQTMNIQPADLGGYECRVSRWEAFLCRPDRPGVR